MGSFGSGVGFSIFSFLPIPPWGVLEISFLHPPRFNPPTLPSSRSPPLPPPQPMEIFVDDETKLTLHGLQQYYVKLKDNEKNRKLFDLLDVLEFNQVSYTSSRGMSIGALQL